MMTTANCGHCSGLMIPDPLDGGTRFVVRVAGAPLRHRSPNDGPVNSPRWQTQKRNDLGGRRKSGTT